jgi:hypothetical protein
MSAKSSKISAKHRINRAPCSHGFFQLFQKRRYWPGLQKKKEKKETIRASPKSQLEVRKDFDHGIITLQSKMRKKRQKT